MGAHTSVLVYYGRLSEQENSKTNKQPTSLVGLNWVLYRYSWAHRANRPLTVVKPVQCQSCLRLHCIECNCYVDRDSSLGPFAAVALLCTVCGRTERRELSRKILALEDSRPLLSTVDASGWSCGARGEWCYEIIDPAARL
jgi:hypothetical protein